jgi:glycosyltransferase involved in cell wall biosynthesis
MSFIEKGLVSDDSRILFVNDGSKDKTWDIINDLNKQESHYSGISLSRNKGHQNALLAGLMVAKDLADVTISIDADGQDDIDAMDAMLDEYITAGSNIVYGVRSDRSNDSFFKRGTAEFFYKFMQKMGVELIFNHADYRLMDKKALESLSEFKESHLFLRGMVPLIGLRYSTVGYERMVRLAGESHYSFSKMLSLALNGITGLSVKPLRFISFLGVVFSIIAFIAIIVVVIQFFVGAAVPGWSSTLCVVLFIGGIQLFCLGIIGEYIGKLYVEVKCRPLYFISETTTNIPLQ